jgi:hypothetical protein
MQYIQISTTLQIKCTSRFTIPCTTYQRSLLNAHTLSPRIRNRKNATPRFCCCCRSQCQHVLEHLEDLAVPTCFLSLEGRGHTKETSNRNKTAISENGVQPELVNGAAQIKETATQFTERENCVDCVAAWLPRISCSGTRDSDSFVRYGGTVG